MMCAGANHFNPLRASAAMVVCGLVVAGARAQCELTEQSSATTPDNSPNDLFGTTIAEDGEWLIVSATRDDDSSTEPNSGSVYVYQRLGVSATYFQELRPSDGAGADGFGTAIDIEGDVIAVGSPFRNTNFNNQDSGAVYVFKFDGVQWVEHQKLFPFPGEHAAGDNFGASVAVSGGRILAGSPNSDFSASNAGAVYACEEVVGFWQPVQRLLSNDIAINDRFGTAISADGDRVVIGAPNDDVTASNSGSVYVFEHAGVGWTQTAKCVSTDPDVNDEFGASVSLWDDRFIVGEPKDDGQGARTGAAYIFRHDGGAWTPYPKLVPPTGSGADEAGTTVAIREQFALVGSPFDRDLTSGPDPDIDRGSATLFVNYNGDYEPNAVLISSEGNKESFLSTGLALSEGAAILGAPGDTIFAQNDAGAIYLYPLFDLEVLDHPDDVVASVGASAQFSVTAVVPPGSTFRWHYEGQPIFDSWPFSGTSTETLQVLRTYEDFEGEFYVSAIDPCGITISSEAATLTISEGCAADTDSDGDVDFNDLNVLLFEFGQACP